MRCHFPGHLTADIDRPLRFEAATECFPHARSAPPCLTREIPSLDTLDDVLDLVRDESMALATGGTETNATMTPP